MYIIGLTGNIATGKSTVCSILEQLGAHVIDADAVAHAILKRGTGAWRGVVDAFGYDILQYDGTVDRRKLGEVVFGDPVKLQALERITHPAVGTELALMVRDALNAPDADEQIIVVEAVKLYEAGMHEYMDALWVVTAPIPEEKRRLIQERGMTAVEADMRLQSQPPLDEKLKRATVIIDNGGSIEETRVQVLQAFAGLNPASGGSKIPLLLRWLRIAPASTEPSHETAPELEPEPAVVTPAVQTLPPTPPAPSQPATLVEPVVAAAEPKPAVSTEWQVRRAKPTDARVLAELLGYIEGRTESLGRAEMLERQGKYAYWIVRAGDKTIALAAWQAENLAAIVRELWVEQIEDAPRVFPKLLAAVEEEANMLTCEVVVILLPNRAAELAKLAADTAGYELTTLDDLHKLWRSVIEPLRQADEPMYAKRLREIVTNPI